MNVLRSFRLRVHNRGESDPTDLTVDFSIGLDAHAAPPVLPGPIVRPFDGRTETQAWNFEVIDTASVITSRLATGGRMHLLGRVVQVQMREDGGAWATIGTARLADLSETQGPGRYTLSLEDERWKERNSIIFTRSDTTSLIPQGIRFPFRRYPVVTAMECTVANAVGNVVTLSPRVRVGGALTPFPERYAVSEEVQDLIIADVKADKPNLNPLTVTTGCFETLRAHCDGVEREILTFFKGSRWSIKPASLGTLDVIVDDEGIMPFHVVWLDTLPAIDEVIDVVITAAEHEPTPTLPWHIGVADATHDWGTADGLLHPFDAVERAYIQKDVRHSAAALATLQADPRYQKSGWRITGPRKLADWAEEAAYQPNLVIPFIDNDGRIAPKAIHNPASIDPDTLFVFDASNTRAPHVTWHHGVREAYNIAVVEYLEERYFGEFMPDGRPPQGADRIQVTEREVPLEPYDTVDQLGPRTLSLRMDGLHRGSGQGLTGFIEDIFSPPAALLKDHAQRFADELFEVAGDGPQTGTIHGMLSTAEVEAGDLVILDQDSLKNPNPAENARSGSRIVRIMQRTFHVDGYEFEYMDVGARLQPLAEPTIAIAQNAANPTNAVDITVSDVPADALVTVFIGTDAAFVTILRELVGVGAGVHTVTGMPSGTTIYAAGYSHAPGRTSSLLSSPSVSVATDADAPMVRDANLRRNADGSATLTWVVNSQTQGVQIAYDAHSADEDPTLTSPADVDATLGTHTFPASVVTDELFSAGITPYPTFSGGAVSGTPGEQVVVSVPTPQSTAVGPGLSSRPVLSIVAGDLVVDWSTLAHTIDAQGVRIYYVAHNSLERPAMTTFVDVDISDGLHTFAAALLTGKFFSMLVEVWTGFSGGSVGGTVGRVRWPITFETTAPVFIGDVGVVTHTMLGDDAVEENNIAIGAVTEQKMADLAIAARAIIDDAVIRRTINAKAIGALEVDDKVLSIQHLVVGSFDNLAQNPGFESGSISPHLAIDSGGAWSVTTSGTARSGAYALLYNPSGQTGTALVEINGANASADLHHSAAVGDRFYAEFWVRSFDAAAANDVSCVLVWMNASGGVISTTPGTSVTPNTTSARVAVTGTAPAGTAYVVVQVAVDNDGNANELSFDDVYFRRMVEGSIVVDGEIIARHLGVESVEAQHIKSKVVSVQHLVVGSFDNLAQNPGFESGVFHPHSPQDSGGDWDAVSVGGERSGGWAARYDPTNQTSTAWLTINGHESSTIAHHAAAEGDKFYAEAWVRAANPGSANDCFIAIQFRDVNGGTLTQTDGPTSQFVGGITYQRLSVAATAPAGTSFVLVVVFVLDDGLTNPLYFDDFYYRRMVEGSIVVDGTILARHIAALTIEVGKHIRSDNYVAGTGGSGWNLDDEEAEFNDVTIRGTLMLGADLQPGVKGTMVHDSSNVLGASTTSGSETDLMSRTLPSLINGDMIDFVAIGTTSADGATKTVRIRLGGSEIALVTISASGEPWAFRGHLVKDGSTTWVIISVRGGVGGAVTTAVSAAVDLSGAVLKVTGLSGNPGVASVTAQAFITTSTNSRDGAVLI